MIDFTANAAEPHWHGYFYAVLLFLTAIIQSIFLQQYYHHCLVAGMRVRTAIIATVYCKVREDIVGNRVCQNKMSFQVVFT